MSKTWTMAAADYLQRSAACPRCDSAEFIHGAWCPHCGADFSQLAEQLRQASARAAYALEVRQDLIDRAPRLTRFPAARDAEGRALLTEHSGGASVRPGTDGAGVVSIAPPGAMPAAAPPPLVQSAAAPPPLMQSAAAPVPLVEPVTAGSTQQLSVQSVLAVAGAGLVAVAAIVFTFFNPELSDFRARSLIVAGITLVFSAAAMLLARRRLAFSAEAVAGLAAVFAVLDLWAVAQVITGGEVAIWSTVGSATLFGSVALVLLASLVRVRVWLWLGLVGLALSPLLFSMAADDRWFTLGGSLAVGFAALALRPLVDRLAPRFGSVLRADATTLAAVRVVLMGAVLLQILSTAFGDAWAVLGGAAALALLALQTGVAARFGAPRFWSTMTGAFGAMAVASAGVALAVSLPTDRTVLALLPLGGTLGALAMGRVRARGLRLRTVRKSAWSTVLIVAVAPTALAALVVLLSVFARNDDLIGPGVASTLGLLAVTAGTSLTCGRARRGFFRFVFLVGLWLGALAVTSFVTWPGWAPAVQVTLGVGIALATSVATVTVLRRRPHIEAATRWPVALLAHLALVLAALVAWRDPATTVVSGVVIVAAVAVVARLVPARFRSTHVAAGFAFALLVFARALDLAGMGEIPLICLTTVLASVIALMVTLTRRISSDAWYAVLGVTTVPFVLGVVSVIVVRSGWTALSTTVSLALALTLVFTTRAGLNRWVRAVAGGLVVPASAVIVVCLGAQVLSVSAAPVTLPVIAAIVAVALAAAPRAGVLLAGRIQELDARLVRMFFEASAYLTGALAVLLALVRSAAGLGTTLQVLLVIGLGAATAGALTRRRLPWIAAAVSFTGALWSGWGLVGVGAPEAYVLPPALAAAALGVVLTRRRTAAGWWFYTTGLGIAVLLTLGLLVAVDPPAPVAAALPWRAVALAAASAVLLLVAWRMPGHPVARSEALPGIPSLRNATIGIALAAAAGPSVQAVRIGLGADTLPFSALPRAEDAAMLPVLAFTALALVLAVAAGRLLAPTRMGAMRLVFVPATFYAVAGPVSAVDGGWVAIVTLWLVMVAVLVWMLLTVSSARVRAVAAPPVWVLFAAAWIAGVAGWSARELRVEVFSLPLGLALVGAGVLAMRGRGISVLRATFSSWPVASRGSWPLLTPGFVVTLLPSMLATATDPLTWRAVLVIALALAAILLGSLFRLKAPFILGILVLPLENAIVFLVQIGRSIGAAPWWMTLATAGAVLLLIAVTSERRTGGAGAAGARLRDLR